MYVTRRIKFIVIVSRVNALSKMKLKQKIEKLPDFESWVGIEESLDDGFGLFVP